MNNEFDEVALFIEATDDIGILFKNYQIIPDVIKKFMAEVTFKIKTFNKYPEKDMSDLLNDLNTFKGNIQIEKNPQMIDTLEINRTRKQLKDLRKDIEKLMEEYGKLKDSLSFGGNFTRIIINRPKAYGKGFKDTEEDYSIRNKNIRLLNRCLDWIEKGLIDINNLISQDLNILSLVDRVYVKRHIYETSIENETTDDELDWLESFLTEASEAEKRAEELLKESDKIKAQEAAARKPSVPKGPPSIKTDEDEELSEEPPEIPEDSQPKRTDDVEAPKNGVRRKELYIAFIEYAKTIHSKNTFGSIFDKDAFKVTYPFVPQELRYFYRLANPLLCVLEDELTFFPLTELRKINPGNNFQKILVFAATKTILIFFKLSDKKVYSTELDLNVLLTNPDKPNSSTVLANTFDEYIESFVGRKIL